MISYVTWVWLWASSGGAHSATITVRTPIRTVKAQTSLAKVRSRGGNTASAFISQVCTQPSPDQVLCGIETDAEAASSVGTFSNTRSVTFELRVNGMFAYATGLVFVLA